MSTTGTTEVLVAGEPRFTDLYAGWLSKRFRVQDAYSSEEASGKLTGRTDVLVANGGILRGTSALARALRGRADPCVLVVLAGESRATEGTDDHETSRTTSVEPDCTLVTPVSREVVLRAVERLAWQAGTRDLGVREDVPDRSTRRDFADRTSEGNGF